MAVEQVIGIANVIIDLLRVLLWPLLLLFVLLPFVKPLQQFANNMGEFTFKAPGVEATAKRQQIEVATLLGAATARQSTPSDGQQTVGKHAGEIADVVAETVTPEAVRRLNDARVLWVDDRPENNIFERRALEALGVRFTLSTSTEDALNKTLLARYDAIISDMGRPPGPRAGYTRLEALRKRGDQTPFIVYAGSDKPEHKAEARKHDALGSTNRPQELFQLVLTATIASRQG
jgi:CheY-like chemotaxis protein